MATFKCSNCGTTKEGKCKPKNVQNVVKQVQWKKFKKLKMHALFVNLKNLASTL